jgi:hypothetical protein
MKKSMKKWMHVSEWKLAEGSHQAEPFHVIGPKYRTAAWHSIRFAAAGRHDL